MLCLSVLALYQTGERIYIEGKEKISKKAGLGISQIHMNIIKNIDNRGKIMRYSLRVNIHTKSWEKQVEDILWACKYANIDEVMLSEQCYHIAPVIQTEEFHFQMAEIYKKIVPIMKAEGIDCSMFVKCLIGHCDADVKDELVLPFQKFMGHSMQYSKTEPCILDENWQDYAANIMAKYAECNFNKMFLDDDFRSTNHKNGETGCFCELHAKKVSQRVGLDIDSHLLKKCVVHNDEKSLIIRKAWLDITFDEQCKTAIKIEKAVHKVNSKTLLGIMNSGENQHAMQGRDMRILLNLFAGDKNTALSRPAGAAYEDCFKHGIVNMHNETAKSICVQGEDVIYVSEVENYPRTIYSKSKTLTDLQMRLHSLAGVSELTLNIFDHFETPFKSSMEYLDLLKENKHMYTEIESRRKGKLLKGVGFPWKKDICYKLVNRSGSESDISINSKLDIQFQLLGIPIQYSESNVNCIEGDMILCYEKDEIINLLNKGLILDRIAAAHLCEMGLSDYIGVSNPELLDECCYECFDDKYYTEEYTGQYMPVYSKIFGTQDNIPYKFILHPRSRRISSYLNMEKEVIGAATSLFENKIGGRVCVFSSPILPVQNRNYKCRCVQLKNIIKWVSNGDIPFIVENAVNVAPIYYEDPKTKQGILTLVNTGFDTQNLTLFESKTNNFKDLLIKLMPFEMKILNI